MVGSLSFWNHEFGTGGAFMSDAELSSVTNHALTRHSPPTIFALRTHFDERMSNEPEGHRATAEGGLSGTVQLSGLFLTDRAVKT
jgi:hypothetical protein